MATYTVNLNDANIESISLNGIVNMLGWRYNFGTALNSGDTITLSARNNVLNGATFNKIACSLRVYQTTYTDNINIELSNHCFFAFNTNSGGYRFISKYNNNEIYNLWNLSSPSASNQITAYIPLCIVNLYDGKVVLVNNYAIALANDANGVWLASYANNSPYPYTDLVCIKSGYSISLSNVSISVSGDRFNFYNEVSEIAPPTDPYSGVGDSDTGGGGGTFDGSSDPVPVPSLPSVGATNTGFISLFVPTQSQLKQVADYLWSPLLDISTFKKIFENPMDCILGLSVVPVTIPTSGSAQITVGNVELSGISLPLASQQYVEIDCGSIPFTDKFFGSYLDQDPYTKMALFVPYSGVHSIKADDVMGKTVNLKYHIDILTGSLVAFLTCGNSVLYEFNGACASNIPVNSMNYASTIENAIRIAVNIGTTVATAGASAPLSGANAATREAARTFGTAVNMAGSTAEGILSLKPNIDRAGSLGGTTGLMGNQIPYFIITRPRLCKPANQNTFKGYPSFIQVTISDLIGEGYTEFDTVVLAGLYLTDGEKEELKQILESGVYL